jgi:hypothetical protein
MVLVFGYKKINRLEIGQNLNKQTSTPLSLTVTVSGVEL